MVLLLYLIVDNETYPGMVKKFLKGTIYAQVIKTRVGARIVNVTKKVITGESLNKVNKVVKLLKTTSNTVNTAFIERFMQTLRQCLCSLHRKTLAAAKTREALVAQLTLFHVFYNFIRSHTSLTIGKGKTKTNAGNGRWTY
jgi:hypothetical protein